MSALTGGSKYSTTDECFFSRSFSDLDYSYDMPNRKHIPMRKIVELPMGERKTLYLGYSCDSIEKDDEFVEYIIMRKENDLFKLQEWGTRKAQEFEEKSTDTYSTAFHKIKFEIIPYDSPEINNYSPEIYDSVETEYIDSKGEKQHVIFFYIWEDTEDNPQY